MPREKEEAGDEERSAPVEEEEQGEGLKERVRKCLEGIKMSQDENRK